MSSIDFSEECDENGNTHEKLIVGSRNIVELKEKSNNDLIRIDDNQFVTLS